MRNFSIDFTSKKEKKRDEGYELEKYLISQSVF